LGKGLERCDLFDSAKILRINRSLQTVVLQPKHAEDRKPKSIKAIQSAIENHPLDLKLETEKERYITIAFFKSNPKYPIVKMYKRLQLGPELQILIKSRN
jgi:hypothetical protein